MRFIFYRQMPLVYCFLLIIRLYFALSPSYIHPDEHFQGPEILAGDILGWQISRPWEFTTTHPIRSILPIWLVYGIPFRVLKAIYGIEVPPSILFNSLRITFFILSLIIDWAVYQLAEASCKQKVLLLHASSYVTWTFQTHTFSNSVEALLVILCIVIARRLSIDRSDVITAISFGSIVACGTFSRINFPAFALPVALSLGTALYRRSSKFFAIVISFLVASLFFILCDTKYYRLQNPKDVHNFLVITPYNNLRYNFSTENLAQHGIHPFYTHLILNLPCLLGPALMIPLYSTTSWDKIFGTLLTSVPFLSAMSGILLLSARPHQEPRFLLPAIPLMLVAFSKYRMKRNKIWVSIWILYNCLIGIFMGSLHQRAVIPVARYLADRLNYPSRYQCLQTGATEIAPNELRMTKIIWWRTYPCPEWLFGHTFDEHNQLRVHSIGGSINRLKEELDDSIPLDYASASFENGNNCDAWSRQGDYLTRTVLVAPLSALDLEQMDSNDFPKIDWSNYTLVPIKVCRYHVNLDDMDIQKDGLMQTARRIITRHGLGVYLVAEGPTRL